MQALARSVSMSECVCVGVLVAQYPTLCNPMACSSPGSSVYGILPDKSTGVDCLSLLQGPYKSRGQTWVSHIAGRFFTIWATREAHIWIYVGENLSYKT